MLRVFTVLLLAGALLACRRQPPPLAVVADRPMTLAGLTLTVAQATGREPAEVSPELLSAFFETQLEQEVLLASSPNPGDRDLPTAARPARARQLLASLCPPPTPPSEAAVEHAVKTGKSTTGERIRLRQLILPDRGAADSARERARRGEDFVLLSRELSRAPNAAAGGLIGWVERGQLPPEFEVAVFGLSPGQVSAPVASNAGWHLFQLMERASNGDNPEARARARAELAARAAETARVECLRHLAARLGVKVDCQAAPFPCRNPFEESS